MLLSRVMRLPRVQVRCMSTLDQLGDAPSQAEESARLPKYTKIHGWAKDGDPNVKKLRRVFSPLGKSLRNEGSIVVLEGKRLISDALRFGLSPTHFLFSQISLLKGFPFSRDNAKDIHLFHTSYKLLQQWSSLTTPTGIMAAFPKDEILALASNGSRATLPITLILDNVRNPDNMGAILRSSAASGVSQIIATHGCVDVWNDKCLRGGCGAHFMVPMTTNVKWSVMHRHVPSLANVALADISRRVESDIEPASDLETRKIVENLMTECASEFFETDPESPGMYCDSSYFEDSITSKYEQLQIKETEYWSFSRGNKVEDTIIVIGGETEGISAQARKFVLDRDGTKYFIPLLNGIESLNVGVATSVLLFEILKSYRADIPKE